MPDEAGKGLGGAETHRPKKRSRYLKPPEPRLVQPCDSSPFLSAQKTRKHDHATHTMVISLFNTLFFSQPTLENR